LHKSTARRREKDLAPPGNPNPRVGLSVRAERTKVMVKIKIEDQIIGTPITMKRTHLKIGCRLLTLAAMLSLALPAALAADAPTQPATAAKASDEPGKVKKSELHDHMDTIEEAMKKLRRTIRKPEAQAQSLDLIARIEQEALVCKGMVPSRTATLPEADRAKFLTAYRKDMAGFITQVLQMESAVLDGDADKAMTIYKGLKTVEDDSHDKYMQPDEKNKAKSDSK
jgi:hypothetical protein